MNSWIWEPKFETGLMSEAFPITVMWPHGGTHGHARMLWGLPTGRPSVFSPSGPVEVSKAEMEMEWLAEKLLFWDMG